MQFAMTGGLWLHRHEWRGRAMAHLVSSDLALLERVGLSLGLHPARIQFRPIKDPATGVRRAAWHWDLVSTWVPPRGSASAQPVVFVSASR